MEKWFLRKVLCILFPCFQFMQMRMYAIFRYWNSCNVALIMLVEFSLEFLVWSRNNFSTFDVLLPSLHNKNVHLQQHMKRLELQSRKYLEMHFLQFAEKLWFQCKMNIERCNGLLSICFVFGPLWCDVETTDFFIKSDMLFVVYRQLAMININLFFKWKNWIPSF